MNDKRSTRALARLSSSACALLVGTTLAALPTAASAKIIKGYTDLYVTEMWTGYRQSGGDTQGYGFQPCGPAGSGPCAKARFSFTYDPSRPPDEMRTSLELIETHYVPTYENPYPDFPSKVIDGKTYLPLPFYSGPNIQQTYPQLGPTFAPGDNLAPPPTYLPEDFIKPVSYDLTRFAVGQPGNSFSLDFVANRANGWIYHQYVCKQDEPWPSHYDQCRNLQGQNPGTGVEGPFYAGGVDNTSMENLSIANTGQSFFDSVNEENSWWANQQAISTFHYVHYVFDNSPENWGDGSAPRSRIWIAEAPEPASLSLLGLGLAILIGRETNNRRRRAS